MSTDAAPQPRFGARVYQMPDGVIQVVQTRKSGPNQNDRYIVDHHDDGGRMRERFIDDANDDTAIGAAIRDALNGNL